MNSAAADEDLSPYLEPGVSIDSDNAEVIAFARDRIGDATDDIEKAKRLYYAVRDETIYDPYYVIATAEGLSASHCLEAGRGFCVAKSALLAASCRVVGIPARVGYADVRNHLSSKRLDELLGTDLFIYHGYAHLHLEGAWVKATPVFNLSLCEKFKVLPLEFDGREDSIFHPHNAEGHRHMEYVNEHGVFADVPAETIDKAFRETYPRLYWDQQAKHDFAAEAAEEN